MVQYTQWCFAVGADGTPYHFQLSLLDRLGVTSHSQQGNAHIATAGIITVNDALLPKAVGDGAKGDAPHRAAAGALHLSLPAGVPKHMKSLRHWRRGHPGPV